MTPVGVELLLMARRNDKRLREIDANIVREIPPGATRVEHAIHFLLDRGLDQDAVRQGSIPEDRLDYIGRVVSDHLPSDGPVRALHVGNFVGVSLAYLSWLVRERDAGSVVVSIDPNLTHRGIENPQAHVLALVHHFGLLDTNLVIPGYSLEQTAGETIDERFETDYLHGLGCENVVGTLARLCGRRFDLALLDGDHEEDYLERELAAVSALLADHGIVVLDDVSPEWQGVTKVFSRAVGDEGFVELGHSGRVGILQLRA